MASKKTVKPTADTEEKLDLMKDVVEKEEVKEAVKQKQIYAAMGKFTIIRN